MLYSPGVHEPCIQGLDSCELIWQNKVWNVVLQAENASFVHKQEFGRQESLDDTLN